MVREALAAKGADAAQADLIAHIKEQHGVELPSQVVSNYKSNLKREANGGAKLGTNRGRKPGRRPGGVQFADLQAVQNMVSRIGADQVKKLVEMAEMFS